MLDDVTRDNEIKKVVGIRKFLLVQIRLLKSKTCRNASFGGTIIHAKMFEIVHPQRLTELNLLETDAANIQDFPILGNTVINIADFTRRPRRDEMSNTHSVHEKIICEPGAFTLTFKI